MQEFKNQEEFLKYHRTGFLAKDAYASYEATQGLAWLGPQEKNKHLQETRQHGSHQVEFRQSGKRNKYVDIDDEGKIQRDSTGQAKYLSKNQILEKELPVYDTTIVAYIDNEPIGLASNQYGSVGILVEARYQKLGIGTHLLHLHMLQREPGTCIGQMTAAGTALTCAYFQKHLTKPKNNTKESQYAYP